MVLESLPHRACNLQEGSANLAGLSFLDIQAKESLYSFSKAYYILTVLSLMNFISKFKTRQHKDKH